VSWGGGRAGSMHSSFPLLAEPCQRREETSPLLVCQETEQDKTRAPAELHGATSKQHGSAGAELKRARLAAPTRMAAVLHAPHGSELR